MGERQDGQGHRGDVIMEAEGQTHRKGLAAAFEHRGRGSEARGYGQTLEVRKARKRFSPTASGKNAAMLTT